MRSRKSRTSANDLGVWTSQQFSINSLDPMLKTFAGFKNTMQVCGKKNCRETPGRTSANDLGVWTSQQFINSLDPMLKTFTGFKNTNDLGVWTQPAVHQQSGSHAKDICRFQKHHAGLERRTTHTCQETPERHRGHCWEARPLR
jgi:hypothetical protein